ncbi:MAG: hypothetical protein K8S55_04155 [Phycisphaerae bacterium]|nr:hypothetical protein [Phycisphaerae bacterium]
MRIDGSIGPEHLNLPNGKPKPTAGKSKSSAAKAASPEVIGDSQRVSAHQSLIQEAIAAEEVNQEAVEAARLALASGELDTFEAARRAAEAMLDFGF